MKSKYIGLFIIAGIATLFFYSCSKSKSSTPTTTTSDANTINITGMSFPATTSVKIGSTVKWNNKDGIAHTVTSNDGTSFSSGSLDPGTTFSYVANTAGSFPYHCNFHSNMKGTLVVTP
jgi:plastocyanin